jgi:preprotein translocase subunit SecE
MNAKIDDEATRLDTVKLAGALTILVTAVGGFYYYAEQALLIRVLGLLAALAVGLVVAAQTALGRSVLVFLQDAQGEVRKVVWPTRAETLQATLAVFVMVVALGIFMWLLDMFLLWAVRLLTGQGA